jgi:hypothetical protein
MRGYKVMYNYKGKIWGMAIAGICLVALLIQKFSHFTIIEKLNSDQHYNVLVWLTLFGLFIMAYSHEKVEDERVKQIRAKALAIAFMIETASFMAFGFALSLTAQKAGLDKEVMDAAAYVEWGRLLMFFPAVAIAMHLIIFHIGLYFDQHWDYSDDITVWQNLKKNPLHILATMIAGVALIEIIATLFY